MTEGTDASPKAPPPARTAVTPRSPRTWALVALAAAIVVHLPSLRNGYTLDDVDAVERDVRIRTVEGAARATLQPYLWNVPPERSPYRPVTTLSYALCRLVGGGDPFAFHLFNVLAHAATTLLLVSVMAALGAGATTAGIAGLVFAVHPVHVEAVANIVGRADVLATFFCLVGVLVHLRRSLRPSVRVAGVCVAYLLAVGSKENGYVLPLLILLVDALPPASRDAPRGWRPAARRLLRSWPEQLAMLVTFAGYALVRRSVLGSVVQLDVAAYIAVLPTSIRITTAVANLAEVARLLLFPNDLSWHYGPAVLNPVGLADGRFWIGVATCAVVVLVALRSLAWGDPGRWTLRGIAWISISFALLSNLLVPMPMWLAERTLYLPSVGVAMMLVGALELLRRRAAGIRRWEVAATVALLVVLGGFRSWQYSKVWLSNDTLFTDLVERHPESTQAARWTGQRLVDAGEVERGLTWLARAVELDPNDAMIRLDYARALLLDHRAGEAERLLRPVPRGLDPAVSVYLAQSLIFQERFEEAREVVDEGLRLFPTDGRLEGQRELLISEP